MVVTPEHEAAFRSKLGLRPASLRDHMRSCGGFIDPHHGACWFTACKLVAENDAEVVAVLRAKLPGVFRKIVNSVFLENRAKELAARRPDLPVILVQRFSHGHGRYE